MKALSTYTFFLLFCFPLSTIYGQSGHHINTAESMNTLMLTSIIRDRNDNMWIGTYNGLYKHEGSRIRAINKIGKGDHSISGGEMHAVFEDKLGFIWIGTTNGLDKINPATYKVQHFALRSTDSASSYVGYIYGIFQDKNGDIWVSTDAALFKINYNTAQYVTVPVTNDKSGVPSPTTSYKSFVATPFGLWMHTTKGLVFYEYASKQFYHRYHNPAGNPVFALQGHGFGNQSDLRMDKNSNLWFVHDSAKLMRYNLNTQRLDSFLFQRPKAAWRCCYSVAVDYRNRVWLGFRHGGLLIFDPSFQTFTPIATNTTGNLLHSNYIYSMEEDCRHRMWVSTHNGLDIIDLDNSAIRRIFLQKDEGFTTLSYEMGHPSTDGDSLLYLPFYRYGFMQVNLNNFNIRSFRLNDSSAAGSTYIIPGSATAVWAARNRRLLSYNLTLGTVVKPYKNNPVPDSVLDGSGDVLWHHATDSSLLYRTNRGGIFYSTASGFRRIAKGEGFKKNLCLSPDKKRFWYITETLNLVQWNLTNRDTVLIDLQKKLKALAFSFSNPRDMVDDGESVWVTGQNGLLRFNYVTDILVAYTVEEGLAHSFTFSLCLDDQRNVWVGSLGGIDVYDKGANRFRSMVSNPTETYMDAFGEALMVRHKLYFISGNKLFIIDPQQALNRKPDASFRLLLQELMVNGETVDPGTYDLAQLSYTQNRLLFRFGLLDFINQKSVKYFYRLSGLEEEWTENLTPGEVSYNSLPPGNYVFHLRSMDMAGNLLAEELHVPFRIYPPFWQRWWFRALLILLLTAALLQLYKQRINKIKKAASIKQHLTELESKALRAQMNPHFIFNSLNAIQELIVTKNVDAAYDYLSKFSKLLRQVLNSSEHSSILLADELGMLRLYLDLESLRFRNSFDYDIKIDSGVEADSLVVPPLLLQPFIENALWHGLMLKEGEKKLTIHIQLKSNELLCTIEDNGIGRRRAAEIKAQRIGALHFESKGVQLSKQRVELLRQGNKGTRLQMEDLYKDDMPTGTRVSIWLPLVHN